MAYKCRKCNRILSINKFTKLNTSLFVCDDCYNAEKKQTSIPPVQLIINKYNGKPDIFDVEPVKAEIGSPKGSNKKARKSHAK